MKKMMYFILGVIMAVNLVAKEQIKEVKASHNDGNVPLNVLDMDFKTRWSADNEAWIQLELEKTTEVKSLDMAFFKGNERYSKIKIETSNDGNIWKEVYSGRSSGTTDKMERFPLIESKAKYIKITGTGNNKNQWNSISEISVNEDENTIKTVEENMPKEVKEVTRFHTPAKKILWNPELNENWRKEWLVMGDRHFGIEENLTIEKEGEEKFFRVRYPKESVSPSYSREAGVPIGGAQFYTDLGLEGKEALELSYKVRFSPNFQFVKGGKLPGFYGGDRNASGKRIPTEDSGFSTRLMWRHNGRGVVYAYLPSSEMHGTDLGSWQFEKNKWHNIIQRAYLNTPGKADGKIEIYLDGKLVAEIGELKFRNGEGLKLDGLFFSTFFGGSDASWASADDVYTDLKDFSVSEI